MTNWIRTLLFLVNYPTQCFLMYFYFHPQRFVRRSDTVLFRRWTRLLNVWQVSIAIFHQDASNVIPVNTSSFFISLATGHVKLCSTATVGKSNSFRQLLPAENLLLFSFYIITITSVYNPFNAFFNIPVRFYGNVLTPSGLYSCFSHTHAGISQFLNACGKTQRSQDYKSCCLFLLKQKAGRGRVLISLTHTGICQ